MAFTYNLSAKIGARFVHLKRGVIKRTFAAVIDTTPVDTGLLKGNWITARGEGASGPVLATLDPSGASTKQAMERAVDSIVDKADGTVSLTNNAGYANTIEYDGHSHTKAPNGMVRINLVQVQRFIDEEARKP